MQNPSDWPKKKGQYTHFSEFKPLDAQDLLKVHDMVCDVPLSERFTKKFHELRDLRNRLTHTVHKNLTHSVIEVLENILLISEYLSGPGKWPSIRREYIQKSRSAAIDPMAEEILMAREFSTVCDYLKPAKLARYFGRTVRGRAYLYYNCGLADPSGISQFRTALLVPNAPDSTKISCFVCGIEEVVDRRDCRHEACKGNVIGTASGEGVCISCGNVIQDSCSDH